MTCSTCGKIKEQHGRFSDHEYECDMMETVSIGGGLSAQSVGAKRVIETISPCSCFDSIHKALLRETGVDEAGSSEGAKKGWDKRGRGQKEPSVSGFEKKGGSFGVGAEPLNVNRDEFGTPIDPSGQFDPMSGGNDLSPYEQNQLNVPDYTKQQGDQQSDFDDPTQNPEAYDEQFQIASNYLRRLERDNFAVGPNSMPSSLDDFDDAEGIKNNMIKSGIHPEVVRDVMIEWGADPSYFDVEEPDGGKMAWDPLSLNGDPSTMSNDDLLLGIGALQGRKQSNKKQSDDDDDP